MAPRHARFTTLKSVSAAVSLAALALMGPQAMAGAREITIADELVGTVQVVAPESEPASFIFLITDTDGITPARKAEAAQFVAHGAAVALVDLKGLLEHQAASDDEDCHYTLGDFEDVAHSAQRQLGMTQWRWPVLVGSGAGAAAAYLALAQAPDNTVAGAVSVGFEPRFVSKLPLCPGAPKTGKDGDAYLYEPMKPLPGRWTLVTESKPNAVQEQFLKAGDGASVVVSGTAEERFSAAVKAALDIAAQPTSGLSDLPLVEIPATGTSQPAALFVLLSGDGGWRDIDKEIGDYLSRNGIGVVGVDSLRYFWSKKDAATIGADLARIVTYYSKLWSTPAAGIGGYSLGADVLPLAWPHIDAAHQDKIGRIVLLGIEPTAALQVTVSGWLGMAGSDEIDLRPSLAQLPKPKVMCFYGADEKSENETACLLSELDGAARFERPGGHHFDGDYEPVAKLIIDALKSIPQQSGPTGKQSRQ